MGDREDKALAAQFPGFSAPGVAAKKPMAASPAPPPSPLDRKSLAAWTGTKRGDFITARREGSPRNAGLGLAITRSIVQAHRGRIHCRSEQGWTTFRLEFPS